MIPTLAITNALSDRNRLRTVMALLTFDELCVCEITELLKIKPPTTSRHMTILSAAGLVQGRKEGRWVYYRACREVNQEDGASIIAWIQSRLATDPEIIADKSRLHHIIQATKTRKTCTPQRSAS